MDEKGFEVAGCRMSNICVSDHLKPEDAAEVIINRNPTRLNDVSPATIMTTPIVIMVIMPANFQDGFSKPNRNANNSTYASTDDLHIAGSS